MLQLLPLLVNVTGALVPVGKVIVVVIIPVVGEVPIFVTVTGIMLGIPATNGVNGCPIVVTKSGDGAAAIGVVGTIVEGLFANFVVGSPAFATVVLKVGVVPTIAAFGVTGTLNVLAAVAPVVVKAVELVQVTTELDVLQFQPFDVNVGVVVIPKGKVIVVVVIPVVAAVPIFEMVTGILLRTPTANVPTGCPIADVKSGAAPAETGIVGVIDTGPLFP